MRVCGGCTLCCKLLPVEELQKPGDEWCKHRVPGACSIYENRPHSCRQWSCLWLTHENMPEELRPDRCHVVFDPTPDAIKVTNKGHERVHEVAQAWVDPEHPKAYRTEAVRAVIWGIALGTKVPTLVRVRDRLDGRGIVVLAPALSEDHQWHEIEAQLDQRWGEGNPTERLKDLGEDHE